MDHFTHQIGTFFSKDSLLVWPALALVAALCTIIVKGILGITSAYLRRITQRTHSVWDDVGVDLIDGLKAGVVFIGSFFLLTRSLSQSESVRRLLLTITVAALVMQFAIWGLYLIKNWRKTFLEKKIEIDPSSSAALGLLYTGTQACFITVLILIGLSNLGVDITALLAGLGVGGIAVALAAQNILGDLLASLSIVLDKPFVVGDFIVAGNEKGTVEHIGIKTTRLRSLSGEQLVVSNKDLLESRVQNFKRMWVRRVVQKFGVVYSTTPDALVKIPVWVKEIVEAHPKLKFDRCHFCAYGPSSLDFELVFFVSDPEYNVFMDLQQRVLIDIFIKFSEENIAFAFPTQTIFVERPSLQNEIGIS